MKKTIMGVVTIVTVLFICLLATSVNAASISADNAKISKGDIVTITVKVDDPAQLIQFDLSYDSTVYEYVENSAKSDLEATSSAVQKDGETVRVSAFTLGSTTTDTLTLQFKAIENGENVPFTITNAAIKTDEGRVEPAFDSTTINVTVAEEEQPTDPTDPSDPTEPTDPEEPGKDEPTNTPDENKGDEGNKEENNGSAEYVDENGNEITKLPQTGSLAPTIVAGAVILVAIIATVAYRAIKK